VSTPNLEPEDLLERAARGDADASSRLLALYRDRLRRMVEVRLDRRLAPRIDPSDVVQEALAEAALRLPDYLNERPLPFYPWLRRLAFERLARVHHHHIGAEKRSLTREVGLALPDESALSLVHSLADPGSSPSSHLAQAELCARVREALIQMDEHDREVLTLRYLEQLPVRHIAATLQISEGAVKMRHLRALEKLRPLLENPPREGER
jgi:RNA polymerase sigma-70 factor (ECF subfamily)